MTKIFSLLAVLFTGCMWAAMATAGDIQAGRSIAEKTCHTCHGVDGVATVAMTPNLSGQQKEYLDVQLKHFRAGKRRHEQMTIIAKMLSDDDIENVIEWYSSIKVTLQLPE